MKWGNPQFESIVRDVRSFKTADWLFIFFTYITIGYLVFNLLEMWSSESNEFSFDFMPIAAGGPAILMGWRAVKLRESIRNGMTSLANGAGLDVPEGSSLDAMMKDFQRRIRLWSWSFGIFIMVLNFAGFWYIAGDQILSFFQQASDTAQKGRPVEPQFPFQAIFLGAVMSLGGLFIGWLLGGLIGYGRLFNVMDKHKVKFSTVATKAASHAMRWVEEAFDYSFQATALLCLWFAAWWTAWRFGFSIYKGTYESFFLILWLVCIVLLLSTAWLPARLLNRRLDILQGGEEGRVANAAQIALASADLVALRGSKTLEVTELEALIAALATKQKRSPWLRPWLLNSAVLANAVLFLVPWYFGSS